MKIKKYIESINDLKPIKVDSNTFNKVIDINDKIESLKKELEELEKPFDYHLRCYLELNPNLIDGYDEKYWEKPKADYMTIHNINNYGVEIEISLDVYVDDEGLSYAYMDKENINDFIEFANNPQAYLDIKKYNL